MTERIREREKDWKDEDGTGRESFTPRILYSYFGGGMVFTRCIQ